ncbi:MAG: TfoX/Sxy family protein [Gallionella sp.]|nr:TfoX/Sxy family protein [Gallionella sp.]
MVSPHNEFLAYVLETMSHIGIVTSRRMFGGYGLYREGVMFALIAEDTLYLKTDADSVMRFEQAGSLPFTYESAGRKVQLSYWSAPADCLESPAEMCDWCQLAYAAALRAQAAKPATSTRKKK